MRLPRLVAVAATATPGATSGSATWATCRGPTRPSTWSRASAGSGARRRTPSRRPPGARCRAAGSCITVWGNVGKSPGAWMFAPFLWATEREGASTRPTWSRSDVPASGEAFLARRGVRRRRAVRDPVRASSTPTRTPTPGRSRPPAPPTNRWRASARTSSWRGRGAGRASTSATGLPLRGPIQEFGYIGTKR